MLLSGFFQAWSRRHKLAKIGLQVCMNVPYIRSAVSITLSCWFGFLACVLGCAQPTVATAPCPAYVKSVSTVAGSKTQNEADCCHHGRSPSDDSRQKQNGASCCPLDATLIQKQDLTTDLRSVHFVAVLMLFILPTQPGLAASGESHTRAIWHTGRDVLLQVCVLRI